MEWDLPSSRMCDNTGLQDDPRPCMIKAEFRSSRLAHCVIDFDISTAATRATADSEWALCQGTSELGTGAGVVNPSCTS